MGNVVCPPSTGPVETTAATPNQNRYDSDWPSGLETFNSPRDRPDTDGVYEAVTTVCPKEFVEIVMFALSTQVLPPSPLKE
jgi:hypothetical protein